VVEGDHAALLARASAFVEERIAAGGDCEVSSIAMYHHESSRMFMHYTSTRFVSIMHLGLTPLLLGGRGRPRGTARSRQRFRRRKNRRRPVIIQRICYKIV